MKKKLLILFLSIISVVCLAFGLSACGEKEVYSTLEMEEGIIYLTDFSVQYTSEAESPDGNIDENSLADEKSGSVQNYFMVMSFDIQTASDIIETEYLTVTLTVLDADVVSTTIDYTNTSATEEKTSDGQTVITATYSLPDKAQLVKSVQLVVELKPNNIGATDITYDFSSDSKSVTGYNNEDCTFKLSTDLVTISQTSLEYTLSDDGKSYTVTGIGTKSGATFIRYTYNDLPVTAIADKAFYNCSSLTSITIPDSVTSIGDSAFYKCTAITSIIIPDSVTSIGSSAFYNCTSLTSITIPDSVTSIGDSAFYSCTSLTSVTISSGVASIGEGAFYNCSSLASVYYNGTASQWASISFGSSIANPLCFAGNLYINNMLATDITLEGITTIKDYAFRNCTSLTSIIIPDSVTSIGNSTFLGCTSLTSITIPDSVTSIGEYAFYNCTALTSVTLGSSVETISVYTFYGCSSLTNITIPDSVTFISSHAFYGCSALTSITIPDSVTYIGSIAFSNCNSLTSITINSDNKYYKSIDGNLYSYDGTKFIQYAPGKTDTSFTIPDSVTSISDYAFYYCTSLTSITIPDSVTSIDSYAFCGCTSLTSITIPDSVTSIGHSAFYGCTSLASVTIGSGVTSIGDSAFFYCASLTSITIPSNVTSIGNSAFQGCSSLTSVTFKDTTTWYYKKTQTSDGSRIPNIYLLNKSTAARYLTNTYCKYYWYKN